MRQIAKLMGGILLLFAVLVGGMGYYVYSGLQPVEENKGQKKIIEIPPSSSTTEIGQILENEKVIKNGRIFSLYLKFGEKSPVLKAGKYQLTVGDTIEQIAARMEKGEFYKDDHVVTIPEGFTIEQIATRLEEKKIVSKAAFLKEVNQGVFTQEILKGIPQSDKRIKYRLEGYLFPDTYEFKKGSTAHDVINKMLDQTEEVWNTEWNAKFQQHHLTRHQAITLASIVEREVRVDEERPIVAGVYFNRLAKQMPLQSDATVQYLFGKQKERVTFADLKQVSPYNTYKVKGLPPGPIASPGKKSLEAVANAQKNEYLFYVTKKDGSGGHYFAKTYEEHLKNIERSKGNEK
ncbi:UPF0755 protein [Aneurinibacillus soli]|uniref:Endolytic murein transglycosylase n=1 Tax=Aneurinibacillus soli TaxID=1500254 RepID=A0A0U5C5D0_9BACL|nr:endolytic transglycosylase MltG [Aneurinibacillus soli]PYE62496.1 UPF0755 protein [Aneurinibacillus soli]BAU27059.1 putative aminodeoxychorismate lyase [Aneurinibacillus soli]